MVACQPAVDLSIFLLVAGNAKTHLKVHGSQPVHGLHLAVAVAAFQLTPEDVRLVVELHIIGHVIDLNPGHWGIGIIVLSFFNNLRVLGNDIFVAEETLLHRRQPRVSGAIDKGMAKPAVDLLDSCMHPMAEKDRLPRADSSTRIKVIEVQHRSNQYESPHEPPAPFNSMPGVFPRCLYHRPLSIHAPQ